MAKTAAKSKIIYTQPSEGFWEIPEVSYRGETANYRLFEKMTDRMNQDNLAEFYKTEKPKGNPHPTDMPLIWAIATRAYEIGGEANLQEFFRTVFRKWPNTLTRIVYNPSGEDRVVHNYNTSDEYSIDNNFVGPDGGISETSDDSFLENILGTNDIKKIDNVSQHINGTNTYIWRLNSKPKQKDERVVRFYALDFGLVLDAYWYPRLEYPAFRVLRVD